MSGSVPRFALHGRHDGLSADIGLASKHPGGVHMAFCDGSVKFVKNTIDIFTWRALGTASGGEVVSADACWATSGPIAIEPSNAYGRSPDHSLAIGPLRFQISFQS